MFKRNAMTYLQVSMTIIATCLCGLSLIRADSKDDKPADKKRIIEAEEFRVVDKNGRIRAVLTVHPEEKQHPEYEDKSGLYLYRSNGRKAGVFGVADDRGYLSLVGDDEKSYVGLHVSKRQGSGHQGGHQGGFLYLTDTNQKGAHIGVWMDYDKPPGPASSIKLYEGPRTKVTWEAK